MRRTYIEFGTAASKERRIAYLSLGVLLTVGAFSALYYWKTLQAVASLSALLQADTSVQVDRIRVIDPRRDEIQQTQLKAARTILDRLRTPWPSLFVALEDSVKADVAVLRIDPDAARQEVRITANAKTMSAAVAYATNLQSTGTLTRVFIASQRTSAADLLNPLQVVVVGRWATTSPVRSQPFDHSSTQALNGAPTQ